MRRRWARGLLALPLVIAIAPTAGADEGGPGPPVNLTFWANPDGTITLAWEPPAKDGGAPLSYYAVERLGVGGWTLLGTTTTQTTFVDASTATTDELLVGYRVTFVNAEHEAAEAVKLGVARTSFVGGPDCFILETSILPPGLSLNVTCAILVGTQPLPEPYRTSARNLLLPTWAVAYETVRRIIPDQVVSLA